MAKAKGVKRFLILVASVFIILGLVAEGAMADQASDEDRMIGHTNYSRAQHGLAPLAVDASLRDLARAHSAGMAGAGRIFHNPHLAAQVPGGWRSIGENVGMGGSVDQVHNALMNSPGHKANITGDYDYFGIGVAWVGGTVYVTEVFFKSAASAPSKQATAAAPSKRKCRKVGRRVRCTASKIKVKKAKKSRRIARRR